MRRIVFLAILALSVAFGAHAQAPNTINTVVGGGANSGSATSAFIPGPAGVVRDTLGNTYVSASALSIVYKITSGGTITAFAGNGIAGFSGDEGAAVNAELDDPQGLALDSNNHLFIADSNNNRIRWVDGSGKIHTYAGSGNQYNGVGFFGGYSGDHGPATSALMNFPVALAFDVNGNLFIADANNSAIRMVDASLEHIITTYAGGATAICTSNTDSLGDGCPATQAFLVFPEGVAVHSSGDLYIADSGDSLIRKVDNTANHIITIYGGNLNGTTCPTQTDAVGDGCPATQATLNFPIGVFVDATENVLIGDTNDARVRMITHSTQIITTIAGTGAICFNLTTAPANCGDTGLATNALLNQPSATFQDSSGNLLFTDFGTNRLRIVSGGASPSITTFAGGGTGGDGGPATSAVVSAPFTLATDSSGNVFFTESQGNRIRRWDATAKTVTTYVGNGIAGIPGLPNGDGGPATQATIVIPNGIALNASADLWFADGLAHVVRTVDHSTKIITTYAGIGLGCPGTGICAGDGGPATSARFRRPFGVAVDSKGNLYISDSRDHRIRRVDVVTKTITNYAGNGTAGYSGDNGPATSAMFHTPQGLAFDSKDNLYVADALNNVIRRIDGTTQIITTYAFNGQPTFGGDGGAATAGSMQIPEQVAVDSLSNLLVGGGFDNVVRRIDVNDQTVITVAGDVHNLDGGFRASDDGGPSTKALLSNFGVAIDSNKNMYIGDAGNGRVRVVHLAPVAVVTSLLQPFGPVLPGGIGNTGLVTITNNGLDDLTVTSASVSVGFTLSNTCLNPATQLPAPVSPVAGSCLLGVAFTPPLGTPNTPFNGNLTFNTNDPAHPSFSFALIGTAVTTAETLTLNFSGGTGTISGSPEGLVNGAPAPVVCTNATSPCTFSFALGQQVTLFAVGSAGSTLTGWTVNGGTLSTCIGATVCTVTMSVPQTVVANFIPSSVTVAAMGNGSGTITSNPAGIDCTFTGGVTSGTCTAGFGTATQVILTATAAAGGSKFAGWLGFCSLTGINTAGTGPCTLPLSIAGVTALNGALATAVFSGPAKTFGQGDVFVGTVDGMIFEYTSTGTLVQVLNSGNLGGTIAGMNFDTAGNLYAANPLAINTGPNPGTVEFFGSNGIGPTFDFGLFNSSPIGVVVVPPSVMAPSGSVLVGQSAGQNTLLQFTNAVNGSQPINTFFPAYDNGGIGYLDLLDDGASVLYSTQTAGSSQLGTVKNFDILNNHQNPDFATGLTGGPAFAIRELPDKSVLVANTTQIVRLDQTGKTVLKTYKPGGGGLFYALTVNPDGVTFWTGDALTGTIYQILISDGSQVAKFSTGLGFNSSALNFATIFGIAVLGQPQSGGADLSINMTASPSPVGESSTLTYAMTVTNNGPLAATNVILDDVFPGSVKSSTVSQGSCAGSGVVNEVICNLGTINSGSNATLSFVMATPATPGILTNTVSVTSAVPDPIPGNNSFTTSTSVVAPSLATISLSAPGFVQLGTSLTYTIQVSNPGAVSLAGISVTDTLPGGLSATSLSPGCTGTTSITCNIATLTPGQVVTLEITIVPTATGVLANTANVTGGNFASVNTSVITGGVGLVVEVDSANPADFITTSPSGGICTTAQVACTVYFPPATQVTVTANGPGFVGWTVNGVPTAACPSASNTCTVTLSSPQLVLAVYNTIAFVQSQLSTGVVGIPYGSNLSRGVIGGAAPYTITLAGTPPAGLTFTAPVIRGTPTIAGNTPLTVNITDSLGLKGSTAVTLSVINAPTGQEGLMLGNYGIVFHLVNDSDGSLFVVVGSLHFNGKGVIDSGTLDTNGNGAGKTPQTLSVTGTYSIGPDHRGLMTLKNVGNSFAFIAMSVGDVYQGVAHTAHIIEFDDNTGTGLRGAGVAKLQDPKAFNAASFAGPYIFEGTGQDSALARVIEEGLFTVTNAGAFGSGSADANDNGTLATVASITGTYSEPGLAVPIDPGTGRTQWNLNGGATTAASYIIDANNVVFITTNPAASSFVLVGTAERQLNTKPFDATFLSGPDVIVAQGPSNAGKQSNVLIGVGTFTPAAGPNPTTGTVSITKDTNDGGNVTILGVENDTYTMAATGRVVVTPASGKQVFGYLSRPDRGYVMGTDSSADFGTIDLQTGGPFAIPTVPTSTFWGEREPGSTTRGSDTSGVTLISNNTLSATFDQSHEGGRLDYASAATFGIFVAPTGRFILTNNHSNDLVAISDEIGEIITPSHVVFTEIDPGQNRPNIHEAESFVMPAGLPLPNPASVNFPTPVAIGSNAQSAPIVFTNASDGLLSITGITNATDFSASSGTCVTGFPVVVLAHSTCTAVVTFAPQPGTATGVTLNENLTLQSDAGSVTITATGTVAAATLQSIAVTPANPSIAKGRTQQFTATGTFSDNSTQNLTSQVTWASATTAVATINAAGVATGVGTGTSNISATLTGITGSTVLTVTAAVLQSIAVTPANPSIAKGRTQQFTATGTFSDNSTQNLTNQVTWASATSAVATITAGGLATGVGTGTSSISATLTGISGSTVLTVTAAVLQSIAVTPANPSIAKGRTQQFAATGTFSDNSTQNLTSQVTWASATTAVATITAGGLATGVGTGTSSISATLTGISGSTVLTVTAAVLQSIAVTPPNPTIATGLTQQFTATGTFSDNSTQNLTAQVTWASAATAVATINAAGLATGVSVGTSNISATLTGITGSTVLTVTSVGGPTLVSIAVTPANPTIPLGATQQFIATGTFSDNSTQIITTSVTWGSATPAVATINNTAPNQGLATSVSAGSSNITATSGNIVGSTVLSVAVPVIAADWNVSGNGSDDKQRIDGKSSPLKVGLTNTSATRTIHITGASADNAAYTVTNDCTTLGPGQSCSVFASFKATQLCEIQATTITVADDDPGGNFVFTVNGFGADSGLQVDNLTNPALSAQALAQSLVGPGVTISNVKYTGAPRAAGNFTGDPKIIGFGSGIVLSSGSVRNVVGPNCSTQISVDNGRPGDTDLNGLLTSGQTTNDAAVLEFDFVPTSPSVSFQYVFSSDEYNEFVGQFNDVFAFFLNGTNIALVPGTNAPVSINNVNANTNPAFFINNDIQFPNVAPIDTEMDGLTVVLTAQGQVTPNQTNHIKLAIADALDFALDSNVFIKAGSLASTAVTLIPATLGFGNQQVGTQSNPQPVTLANAGTTAVNISSIAASAGFGETDNCPKQLAPAGQAGSSCTLNITFDPTSNVVFNGTVTVTDDSPVAGSQQVVTLTGTGTGTGPTLQSITVAPPTASIAAGTTQPFTATGHFSDGSTGPVTVTWSSGNTAIATINATTGVATGVTAGGPVTITATSTQTTTISGTAQLTITAPVLVSIAVTPANPTVVVGQTQQFTATGTFSDKSTQDLTASVAWSSSNTEAASITEGGGLATGLTGGENTTISATKALGNTNIVGTTTLTVTSVPFILTITPPPGGNPGAPPTISPGGTLAIGLTLTAAPGFTGTVSFGCVSNQPQFLTCTPAPSSVTLSGNTPKQVAIVMNTFCQGETPMYGPGPGGFGGGLALLLAAAMLGSITWAYRTRSRWALSFAVLLLMALGSAACSSPSSGPAGRTPAGTYVLSITATAGGTSQTVQQTIQVTP